MESNRNRNRYLFRPSSAVASVGGKIKTDKERLENIKEQYQWAIENRLANRIDDSDIDWLIEQAERAEKNAQDLEDMDRQLYSEQQQNKRYKQALEFYADEEHYKEKLISEAQYDADGICISNDEYAPPIIYFDSGEKARQALEGKE